MLKEGCAARQLKPTSSSALAGSASDGTSISSPSAPSPDEGPAGMRYTRTGRGAAATEGLTTGPADPAGRGPFIAEAISRLCPIPPPKTGTILRLLNVCSLSVGFQSAQSAVNDNEVNKGIKFIKTQMWTIENSRAH